MMEFLWNFGPFLTAGVVALTVIFGIFCARTELRLAARRRISLSNYKQKSNLFYITKDKPFAITSFVMAGVCLILMAVMLTQRTVRIYALPIGLTALANAALGYLGLTRHRCARDVRVFDVYYVQIENMLASKQRTQADIRVCLQRVEELRSRLSQTIAGFNNNLAVGISGDFLPELFAPLDGMIAEYQVEIDRFSAEIEQNFNAALHEFLKMGTVPALQVVPLRHFDDVTVGDLLGEIKSSYGGRIAEMVVEQVNQGAVRGARALGNIMTLLHQIEVEVDVETLERFLYAASRFEDRAELAELLYRNKQIPLAMVRRIFVPKNWEWTFVPGIVTAFNNRELALILSDVLANDSKGICYRMLTRLGASQADILEKALATERERSGNELNETTRLATAHGMILSNAYAVGNSGNLYENLAYMLYDHVDELGMPDEIKQRVCGIVQNEAFYVAREEIVSLYHRAMAAGGKMVDSTTRILLQYIMNAPADFLDPQRAAALFGEYRTTLSFGDMGTLRALLAVWLLINVKNEETLRIVLNEVTRLPVAQPFPQVPPIAAARDVAHNILAHLTQKDRVRLRSVIYRTESQRLTLDRVLAL